MFWIVIFSITIALFSMTHHIGYVLTRCLVVIFSNYLYNYCKRVPEDKNRKKQNFFGRQILSILGVVGVATMSVVFYDLRQLGFSMTSLERHYYGISSPFHMSPDAQFRVESREKQYRYSIQDVQTDNRFLLFSEKRLTPGQVVVTTEFFVPRVLDFSSQYFSFGQYGQDVQVVDNKEKGGFDYDRWLYTKGWKGSLYDDRVLVIDEEKLGFLDRMREKFYRAVQEKYRNHNDIVSGLILGMTIGDRSLIDEEWYDQFVDSGLVHLIAVSGGNIAIVVLFLSLLFFWLPAMLRYVMLMLAIVGYGLVVGSDSSIIRACIMGILTLLVLLPGRELSIWRSMAYARVLMLLYNPYYLLYDLGFGLSFAAIIGIIECNDRFVSRFHRPAPPLEQKSFVLPTRRALQSTLSMYISRIKGVILSVLPFLWYRLKLIVYYSIQNYILPTLGASLAVTPLLLYAMDTTNLLSALLNFLIVPLVPLITIAGFILPWFGVTLADYILVHLIEWITILSYRGRTYGVYLSIDERVKTLLLFLCIASYLWYYYEREERKKEEILS